MISFRGLGSRFSADFCRFLSGDEKNPEDSSEVLLEEDDLEEVDHTVQLTCASNSSEVGCE